jgi:hypothetical protein
VLTCGLHKSGGARTVRVGDRASSAEQRHFHHHDGR